MTRRSAKVLTSMVVAGAMFLSFSTEASASSGTAVNRASASVVQAQSTDVAAKAQKVFDESYKSLQATGSAAYTALDGSAHLISVTDHGIVVDGKSVTTGARINARPTVGASVFCDIKVAAAVTALVAVGVAYIAFLITGLSEATTVAIAGISLKVVQWQAVIAGGLSTAALTNLLKEYLC